MSSPHFDEVQSDLRANPDRKWGFVILRCTYGDDAAWERMMSRLNTQARNSLDLQGASDLFPRIDWRCRRILLGMKLGRNLSSSKTPV